MGDIFLALLRTAGSLRVGRVWVYLLAPAAFSLFLSLGLAFWGLRELVDWLLGHPPMSLLVGWGVAWLAHFLAWLGGWMAIFAFAYLCSSLLAAVFVMPLLLRELARGPYRDVAALGRDSFIAALVNSLGASLFFVLGWLLALPLWLVPGLSLLLPLLLMAWFNSRTFAYDALAQHATDDEWQALRAERRRPLFMLGLIMAMLAHVPLIGLLVPTLAALAYAHFGLENLRRLRGGALMTGEAVRIVE